MNDIVDSARKNRIGELLLNNKSLTRGQLTIALAEQKKTGKKLGKIIIDLGFITEDNLITSLSQQLNIPVVDIKFYQFDKNSVHTIPESLARRYRIIILSEDDFCIHLGMVDPTNIYIIDEIQSLTKKVIKQAIVRERDLLNSLDSLYRKTDEISSIANELALHLKSSSDFNLNNLISVSHGSDTPVVRLLYSIFQDAILTKASDIHIEPDETVVRLRQRIDGILHEQIMSEKEVASALVSRLKVMANLDISEKRLPQDGRFNIKVNDKKLDIRISTLPVQFGESIVMRILDQSMGLLQLDHLGIPESLLEKFKHAIHLPHGMILVTGPTGSGKTTTLYAALNQLNTGGCKIITAEDPVEYRLPRISQVQVNPMIGLSFSSILRSALRQDPDILLIGEMRDQETVDVGIRAAMTGHLVFSTLHTNDAASAIFRLIDMGSEPYLIAGAVRMVIAQRLVRKICEHCKCIDKIPEKEILIIKNKIFKHHQKVEYSNFYFGKGCHQCHNSGFSGRIGVFELIEIDRSLYQFLIEKDIKKFMDSLNENAHFNSLVMNAFYRSQQGVIPLSEVTRLMIE